MSGSNSVRSNPLQPARPGRGPTVELKTPSNELSGAGGGPGGRSPNQEPARRRTPPLSPAGTYSSQVGLDTTQVASPPRRVEGFWGHHEPADNNPRLTIEPGGSRSAAPSTAEVFFGLPQSSSQRPKTGFWDKSIARLAPLLPKSPQQQSAQIRDAANLLIDALTSGDQGRESLLIAMNRVSANEIGPDVLEVLKSRLSLQRMGASELEAAYGLMSQEVPSKLRDVVCELIDKELTKLNPGLSPALHAHARTLLDTGADREATSAGFAMALSIAEAARETAELQVSAHEIVLDALAYVAQKFIDGREEPIEKVNRLIIQLPSAQLREIAQASPAGLGMLQAIRPEVARCASDELDARQNSAHGLFVQQIGSVENWERQLEGDGRLKSFRDPVGLAKLVIEASNSFVEIGACGGALPAIQIGMQSVDRLMHPWNISRLDFLTLKQLEAAVGKMQSVFLGGTQKIQERIRSERDARKEQQRFVDLAPMRGFVSGLLALATTQTSFAQAIEGLMRDVQTHMSRHGHDAGQFLREIKGEIGKLPWNEKRALWKVFTSAPMSDLIAILSDLSVNASVKEHEGRADALNTLALTLMAARAGVYVRPGMPEYSLQKLDPDALGALEGLGINLHPPHGHVSLYGNGSRALQQATRDHLLRPRNADLVYPPLSETAQHALITVQGIPAYKLTPDDGDAKVSKIATTPAIRATLARVASLAAWNPIDAALKSTQSPLRLPDGTPIDVEGDMSTAFDLRRGPDGGVIVSCRLAILNITSGLITEPSGVRRRVDVKELIPGDGLVFTLDVAIDAQGDTELVEPTSMHPARWADRPYPEPRHAKEVTSSNAQRHLAADFMSFVIGEYSDENSRILNALNEFERKPELRRAIAIVGEYIASDNRPTAVGSMTAAAENDRVEANIPASLRQDVEAAVERARLEPSPEHMAGIVVQFGRVHAELTGLVDRDTFQRFTKSVVSRVPPLRKRGLTEFKNAAEARSDSLDKHEVALDADQKARVLKLIGFRFGLLEQLKANRADIASTLEAFRNVLPKELAKGPPPGAYREQVRVALARLPNLSLASVLTNLRTAVPSSIGSNEPLDPYVAIVIQEAGQEWRQRFTGAISQSCESMLLKSSVLVPTQVVALWFEQGRINYAETKVALGIVHRNDLAKYEALKPFASELRRKQRSSDPLADFASQVLEFSSSSETGVDLVPAILTLKSQFDQIPPGSPDLLELVSAIRTKLRENFVPHFNNTAAELLDEPTLRRLIAALGSFRFTNVNHIIETRLKELADRPPEPLAAPMRLEIASTESIPRARDEPPSESQDDVPPLPPESPGDVPPPPPESPGDVPPPPPVEGQEPSSPGSGRIMGADSPVLTRHRR